MNYPTLYIMLDYNTDILPTEHISALCNNARVGILRKNEDVDDSFAHFRVDYEGIMRNILHMPRLAGSNNVIAVETDSIPDFLQIKYADSVKAMYWVKDPKTSVEIQAHPNPAVFLRGIAEQFEAWINKSTDVYLETYQLDWDMRCYADDPLELVYSLLEPLWSELQNRIATQLRHNCTQA